jgi:prepilin-type N-terminal cleavage/methylation domain-containing protein
MFAPLKNQKGFTLIELVIIIIMIGMLAAIAVPRYVDLKDKALAAGAKATLDGGRAAITLHFANAVVNVGSYTALLPNTTAGNAVTDASDLTGLEDQMQGVPNYPPTGAYNSGPSVGFRWYVLTAGTNSPAVPPVIDAIIDTECDAADSEQSTDDQECWVSKL